MSIRRLAPITILVALAWMATTLTPAASAQTPTCDVVAATNGLDSNPGTVAAPLATAGELVESLSSGQTGCLRAGTYVDDQFRITSPGVRLTSFPGERATLQGRLRIDAEADGAVVENLILDGRNPSDWLGPLIYADHVVLRGNDISNDNTAICVHIDSYPGSPPPQGVVIENNRIHHCGVLPATNHHHGIYVANADGTVIRDNVIYANADRGVQLYPDADGSLITGNVIDGNGQGVIFSGGAGSSSDDNLLEGNVITNSKIRHNIESHWQGPEGTGNVARRNCVWGGVEDDGDGGIETPGDGFALVDNVIADPQYANRPVGDYTLASASPCLNPPDGRAKGGTACTNVKRGSGARDLLVGTPQGDQLTGGGGRDRLRGNGGRDCLSGGAGRDLLRAADGRRDVVRCNGGRDKAVVDRKDRVRGCERVVRRA